MGKDFLIDGRQIQDASDVSQRKKGLGKKKGENHHRCKKTRRKNKDSVTATIKAISVQLED